ncbi:hypothetical protein GCM10009546_04400 [Actinomadura livida]|uniref:Uncharacterized protein n=1 Tax=Actinomadura livida TaxID=79909 RepID=A0ABN1DJS4_9ACTN|nr:hypothetical protein GCM10010208_30630 [Actinomadura livida]
MEKPGDTDLAARIEETLVTVSVRACLAIALRGGWRVRPSEVRELPDGRLARRVSGVCRGNGSGVRSEG